MDKEQLLKLGSNFEEYRKWKTELEGNVVDTLILFPSIRICAATLISNLPIIRPRRYSIASNPASGSFQAKLVVGVVDYFHKTGTRRFGLASGQLLDTEVGENIFGFVRSETGFKLPEDHQKEIILIAAGSGIAPFRGFWMKRAELLNEGQKVGKTVLYFGCKNRKMDLLNNETEQLERNGVEIVRKVAFSQEPGMKKKYVQDILLEDDSQLFRMIKDGAAIYVCGKIAMAKSVQESIITIIQKYFKIDKEVAENIIMNMKQEKMYQEDIFG